MKFISHENAVEVDRIAKRYGVLPSVLRACDVDDYAFNRFVAYHGITEDNARAR